jgi:tripartite-type tricarboxylate transporter receptor subunit TctC
MKLKISIAAFVALAAATWIPNAAQAQDYPSRAIKIVAGFPPGGGVDTVVGDLRPTTPEEMRDRVKRELATWIKIVDEARILKQ